MLLCPHPIRQHWVLPDILFVPLPYHPGTRSPPASNRKLLSLPSKSASVHRQPSPNRHPPKRLVRLPHSSLTHSGQRLPPRHPELVYKLFRKYPAAENCRIEQARAFLPKNFPLNPRL